MDKIEEIIGQIISDMEEEEEEESLNISIINQE